MKKLILALALIVCSACIALAGGPSDCTSQSEYRRAVSIDATIWRNAMSVFSKAEANASFSAIDGSNITATSAFRAALGITNHSKIAVSDDGSVGLIASLTVAGPATFSQTINATMGTLINPAIGNGSNGIYFTVNGIIFKSKALPSGEINAGGTGNYVVGDNYTVHGANNVLLGPRVSTRTGADSTVLIGNSNGRTGGPYNGGFRSRSVVIGDWCGTSYIASMGVLVDDVILIGSNCWVPASGQANIGGSTISRFVIGSQSSPLMILDVNGSSIGTTTAMTGYALTVATGSAGSIWAEGDVSADSFTDRSAAPENLAQAYEIVTSHETRNGKVDHSKLSPLAYGMKSRVVSTGRMITKTVKTTEEIPLEEREAVEEGKEPVTTREVETVVEEPETVIETVPDSQGRNLSMVISAQAMVIADLEKRLKLLEAKYDIPWQNPVFK